MKIESITNSDLDEIKELQPVDWPDIVIDISYYIKSDYCYPVKFCCDGIIAGVGALILFNSTAWLAHIIVRPDYRNKGIGSLLVKELLNLSNKKHINNKLLIATSLGEPVYLKAGFRKVTDYVYLKRIKQWPGYSAHDNIQKLKRHQFDQVLEIDKYISGENREKPLNDFKSDTIVYAKGDDIYGYYLPSLKEGPIVALDNESGLELMKVKYEKTDKAVLPIESANGINFLIKNGFEKTETKGVRMILGDDIKWQPDKIFSRIGGNFG